MILASFLANTISRTDWGPGIQNHSNEIGDNEWKKQRTYKIYINRKVLHSITSLSPVDSEEIQRGRHSAVCERAKSKFTNEKIIAAKLDPRKETG